MVLLSHNESFYNLTQTLNKFNVCVRLVLSGLCKILLSDNNRCHIYILFYFILPIQCLGSTAMTTSNNIQAKKISNILQYSFFTALGFILLTIIVTQYNQKSQIFADNVITVYKSSTCGCCKNWITHLEENGFKVKAIDSKNLSQIKNLAGIPSGAGSCHTAFIDNYVIEGHVPANDIKKLLTEKRQVAGLTVPGMPMGSPGMEGGRVDHYSVYEFDKQGQLNEVNQY